MKKLLLTLAIISSLSGCASMATFNHGPIEKVTYCRSESQCQVMMAAARSAIQQFTGMRLRIVTDTYAETFVNYGTNAHAAVSLSPAGANVTKLAVTFYASGDPAYQERQADRVIQLADLSGGN